MDASFCVDCLEQALVDYGKPEVFNTDQCIQFTSVAFTGMLKREGVDTSMDGRGRALDNIFVKPLWRKVKYEDVYLNGSATIGELHAGLTRYFAFYNGERPRQGLEYRTPNVVYESGKGGGVMIVDKYGSVPEPSSPEPVPALDACSAWEHGALPETPPCRDRSAMIATLADG